MRVAAIAGSVAAGLRIAAEVECLPGIEVFLVCCNPRMRSPFLWWLRELALALKSLHWRTCTARLWSYARSGRLVVLRKALDHPASVERLRSLECEVGLHSTNVIYRDATIAAFRSGILNAHIGILPGYRGRSVAEWSVLQGDPTGVTVFFIDSGIDTGARIVLREFVPPGDNKSVKTLKKVLFGCDAGLYRKALETFVSDGFQCEHNKVVEGKRYYVMSKMFTQVADEILRVRAN
jgi:Formyl transferase